MLHTGCLRVTWTRGGHWDRAGLADLLRRQREALQRRTYTAASASRALDVLLRDPVHRRNAQSIAAKIAHEDSGAGVCAGVEIVLLRKQSVRA